MNSLNESGKMLPGYSGRVLRVDLTRRKIRTEQLSENLARKFIGGYGLAGYVLYKEVPPWVTPFDPLNLLIFSTGPLTGTSAPSAGRYTVVAKSPLTGYFGDANGGGFFGPEMKFAGYDMVVISGCASEPVYLMIQDGGAEIRDATSYWGMDTATVDRSIQRDIGDPKVRVATIGPAGENLVRFAGVVSDEGGRFAARCGLGAVMGFKKLKAVAVRGHQKVAVADETTLRSIARDCIERAKTDPFIVHFRKTGTAGSLQPLWYLGDVPAYNWSRTDFGGPGDPSLSKLSREYIYEEILEGHLACYLCPISCRKVVTVREAPYETEEKVEHPEYESTAALGTNCGIDNIKAIAKLNELCNIYGLDTISTGSAIAFCMECFERGLITKEDTGGLEMRFGNDLAAIEMTHKIAKREGFGNILAEGVRRVAKVIGGEAEQYAIHVKGQEISMHDPRAFQSGGPAYATASTGGRHTEGLVIFDELLRNLPSDLPLPKIGDMLSTEGKAELAKLIMDWNAFVSLTGLCLFAPGFGLYEGGHYGGQGVTNVFTAVTGQQMTISEGLRIGERIVNLRRAFNIRHGCTESEDTLPQRLLTEKGKTGAAVKLHETLPEYYRLRDWDPVTGKPSRRKLLELELDDVANDLWSAET